MNKIKEKYIPFIVENVASKNGIPQTKEELVKFSVALHEQVEKKQKQILKEINLSGVFEKETGERKPMTRTHEAYAHYYEKYNSWLIVRFGLLLT